MKRVTLCVVAVLSLTAGTAALAALSGIGGVAAQATTNLGAIARLITAASYVAGMAFVVGAIVKFKAHKENPTQIPIGTPIALLFVGAALLFVPSVYKVSGGTLFGASGTVAGVSGVTEFGAARQSGGGT